MPLSEAMRSSHLYDAAVQGLIRNFSTDSIHEFFRRANPAFAPRDEDRSPEFADDRFRSVRIAGELEFDKNADRLGVAVVTVEGNLTDRSSRKTQFEKAKAILKSHLYDGGIFFFHDAEGRYRCSLVYPRYVGTRKEWHAFRRFTFFVDPQAANKTFYQQMRRADFSSFDGIKKAFSLSQVTDAFYADFESHFRRLLESVRSGQRGRTSREEKERFAILFAIRLIFLGFLQKKGWLGDSETFLQDLLATYKTTQHPKGTFYEEWLKPLFFEALNHAPGGNKMLGTYPYPPETLKKLRHAPYLNGGLFREHALDKAMHYIPDEPLFEFFDFLFSYNFTIEENTLYDEELELNPEFLGIIFERLINKGHGAVYTPRTEVDFMCRLGLVQWLKPLLADTVPVRALYTLFFPGEAGEGPSAKDLTGEQARAVLERLRSVTVCDPAAGSGAFLVGMLHVLAEAITVLESRRSPTFPEQTSSFELKRAIIERSLYGVEVEEWAVWICQLRLWITLFIEAPDDLKLSVDPILPSLDFKVRQGDAIVQRIGGMRFPVDRHPDVSHAIRQELTELKKLKTDFFHNRTRPILAHEIERKERRIFERILDEKIRLCREGRFQGFQIHLFDEHPSHGKSPAHDATEEREEQIRALEREREALREEKRRPFLWSVDFPEIFTENEGFDIVIANPPYIRQEKIADPQGLVKDPGEYKRLLMETVRMDFPRALPDEAGISAKSDLYCYFYLHGLKLLNPSGLEVFIASNSWLDAGYGVWMQQFLLRHTRPHYIIDNLARRSFEHADVNTVITLVSAPQVSGSRRPSHPDHTVKFVAFKRPFDDALYSEILADLDEARTAILNETCRLTPKTVAELWETGLEHDPVAEEGYHEETQRQIDGISKKAKFRGDKWGGKYLRAPDIYYTILEKGKDKFVRLGDVAEIRRGFTTGANDFFYLDKAAIEEWQIEQEFLKPVILGPQDLPSFLIESPNTEYRIFICNLPKSKIKGSNALTYIKYGEDERFWKDDKGQGIPPAQRPSCRNRPEWYMLPQAKRERFPDLLWTKTVNDIHKTPILSGKFHIDQRLYGIHVALSKKFSLGVCLNSTLFWLFKEIAGVALGLGALDTTVSTAQEIPIINPDLIPESKAEHIIKKISNITPGPINAEIILQDGRIDVSATRKTIDDLIFEILNLQPTEIVELYRTVHEMVTTRLKKADSTRTPKKPSLTEN